MGVDNSDTGDVRLENASRHKYEYTVDLSGDTAPARVIRMVGKGKRVLEIGAGPGSITRLLRDSNHCRITALEIDREAIKKLAPFCERVYQADLNNSAWPEVLSKEDLFEVVVAADVLEHLYDPLATLKAMKSFVERNGYIMVSLPHAAHCAILACLLEEDFDYRDWGLLDRTHIRFFGLKNIQALFENAGLKIVDAQFVIVPPEDTELSGHWARLPIKTRNVISAGRFGSVYQVVIKAAPKESFGKGLTLLSLPLDAPQRYVVFKHRIRNALMHTVRGMTSPEARYRMSRIASRLGIRK
jgi:2-polyprenyl-3-methyl-5-hydroxy-6-metoxy-1,4-benzoquinol methylase